MMARINLDLQQPGDALDWAQEAVASAPDDMETLRLYGDCLLCGAPLARETRLAGLAAYVWPGRAAAGGEQGPT